MNRDEEIDGIAKAWLQKSLAMSLLSPTTHNWLWILIILSIESLFLLNLGMPKIPFESATWTKCAHRVFPKYHTWCSYVVHIILPNDIVVSYAWWSSRPCMYVFVTMLNAFHLPCLKSPLPTALWTRANFTSAWYQNWRPCRSTQKSRSYPSRSLLLLNIATFSDVQHNNDD